MTAEERRRRLNPPSKLTVGARGLTKHAHRSSEGFWGENRGTEVQKNENAREKLNMIISEAVWVNLHLLPHQEVVIEIRIEQGYGMRWTIDGTFRGFLEP